MFQQQRSKEHIKTGFQRYFYTDDKSSFEQSLDVWKPIIDGDNLQETDDYYKSLPLVVLVVGSGWVGHRSFFYTGTSWWNGSGPRTFARLGCVCVCIRHRGGFPKLPNPTIVFTFIALLSTILASCYDNIVAYVATFAMFSIWALLVIGERGSAKFDNMLEDVADALKWVHDNREEHLAPPSLLKNKSPQSSQQPIVFGGYSSGGHVAACVLQRPDLLKYKGLPEPEKVCDAVLMVSGVLAVRPPEIQPSLKQQQEVLGTHHTSPPRFLVDFTLNAVFGNDATEVPSPLYLKNKPRLPTLLIGCTNEVFGLDWLDTFFSSKSYAKSLEKDDIPARYVEISSDHWNILNSNAFYIALKEELQWISSSYGIAAKGHNLVDGTCIVCKERYCVPIFKARQQQQQRRHQ